MDEASDSASKCYNMKILYMKINMKQSNIEIWRQSILPACTGSRRGAGLPCGCPCAGPSCRHGPPPHAPLSRCEAHSLRRRRRGAHIGGPRTRPRDRRPARAGGRGGGGAAGNSGHRFAAAPRPGDLLEGVRGARQRAACRRAAAAGGCGILGVRKSPLRMIVN